MNPSRAQALFGMGSRYEQQIRTLIACSAVLVAIVLADLFHAAAVPALRVMAGSILIASVIGLSVAVAEVRKRSLH
jgi:hypothetical protein